MNNWHEKILAGSKRPDGLATNDLEGNGKTAASAISRALKLGLIFRATLGHRTVRYFDTPARAAAYASKTAPPRPHRGPQPRGPGWGPDDPMHITSETKVTVAPSPPAPTRSNTHPVY